MVQALAIYSLPLQPLMASSQQVRQYIAYWFQLGKGVVLENGRRTVLPRPVLAGSTYSDAFEKCWQEILAAGGNGYLEGTQPLIAELLTPAWDIDPCARCAMPVPIKTLGLTSLECPCIDIPTWPNTDIPQPRAPVETQRRLAQIRDRLS
jgi:hypothetical protein